jgi:plasmid stabilization system protein ParE
MNYRILRRAQRDMREIDDWVLQEFGQRFADRTERRLHETFDLLTKYPAMGIVRRDTKRPVRFFHLQPYWIVYQPGETILIHRIYHSARDLNRLNLR